MLDSKIVSETNQFDRLRQRLQWESRDDHVPINSAVQDILEELITIVEKLQEVEDRRQQLAKLGL